MDEMIPKPPISNDNEMMHDNRYTTMVHSNEIAHGNELVVHAEEIPPTSSRGQKRKSAIWEHFTLVDVSEGCKRANCIHCNQSLAYSSGSKNSGTSHLTRHIAEWCRALKNQQKSSSYRYGSSNNANASFDQERSCSRLAKMIILNDYPLHIVQQPAFLSFVDSMQSNFKMVDIGTIETEVYAIYLKERDHLQQALENIPGRISLTVGSLTTNQSIGYFSLAAQFIDSEWRLHRRMLNFMMASWPQSENAVSIVINKCLFGWNMQDKLFTITLEHDCSSHDICSANLRNHLSSDSILKGQLFVMRCYANILNAVAHDVLASVHNVIYLIRESIKFIKADIANEKKFSQIAENLEISSTNTLCLDVTTEWSTTYLMLLAALDYRQVFTLLESCYDNYGTAPSTEDWKKVEAACGFLKLLYTFVLNIMSAEGNHPTANIFFHDAWILQLELQNSMAHEDDVIRGIAIGIHERFDKYWKDCNVVLAIAVVMDPRFKMKMVEFAYSKIYGPTDAAKYVKVVDDAVLDLYKEYVAQPLPLSPIYIDQVPADGLSFTETGGAPATTLPSTAAGAGLVDFDMYLSEVTTMGQPSKHELELYLEEALTQRTPEFDVLKWWQDNTLKYPTLSRMARDVLAIPMSTAGVGSSVFLPENRSRSLDDHRSSLRPELVEALHCAKDWLQYSP